MMRNVLNMRLLRIIESEKKPEVGKFASEIVTEWTGGRMDGMSMHFM